MIQNLTDINQIIKIEKLDICVVSYGGSGSNEMVDNLEKNGYRCRTPTWEKLLCHCSEPLNIDIPIIYIYRNLIDAFFSMKRRGYDLCKVNYQKLSNNKNVIYSDRKFIESMLNQFLKWKNSNLKNVLFINYKDCFNNNIKNTLETFLNKKLQHFPFIYKTPKTSFDINNIDIRLKNIFNEYKLLIEETNK